MRACVSAVARHVHAQKIGMEGLVPARMAHERTIAAAGVELYASPRWTDAAWRADRAWRQKAALEPQHAEAVKNEPFHSVMAAPNPPFRSRAIPSHQMNVRVFDQLPRSRPTAFHPRRSFRGVSPPLERRPGA